MKKLKNILIAGGVFMILCLPLFAGAQEQNPGLVPCGNGDTQPACDWNGFMALINGVIDFILFKMAIPIAAIMFAYAGLSLAVAGGGEAKTKAKHIFSNTIFGLVIAIAAWLIISTILAILGYDGSWIGLKIG